MVPVLFQRSLPPDVVVVHCAPPREGMLSLGIEVNVLPAAIEACRARGGLVIAVINTRMPYTFGDAEIAVELVDLAVEIDFELAAAHSSPSAGLTKSRLGMSRSAQKCSTGWCVGPSSPRKRLSCV